MKEKVIRSPFFYVGDKYKLMPQLKELFPWNINRYIEPFVGGGSSFLNVDAQEYLVNDIDKYVVQLHRFLCRYVGKRDELVNELYAIIDKYKMSCSYRNIVVPDELKKQYVKTYYSHYNKLGYSKMKEAYNKKHEDSLLYLLLIYGFNHMIRFNSSGVFNLPVGNVDFNKNVYNAISDYLVFMETADVEFYSMDYAEFIGQLELRTEDFIYCDPPYLVSDSEYNKLWDEEEEIRLCGILDDLDARGIRFGITNLVNHKGKSNTIFSEWAQKYTIYNISSNYISFNDNTIKDDSKEVYVTNA